MLASDKSNSLLNTGNAGTSMIVIRSSSWTSSACGDCSISGCTSNPCTSSAVLTPEAYLWDFAILCGQSEPSSNDIPLRSNSIFLPTCIICALSSSISPITSPVFAFIMSDMSAVNSLHTNATRRRSRDCVAVSGSDTHSPGGGTGRTREAIDCCMTVEKLPRVESYHGLWMCNNGLMRNNGLQT